MEEKSEEPNKQPKIVCNQNSVLCVVCDMPSAYFQMLNNQLVRVTGTFRVGGTYQTNKGKVVSKVYAHYPDCGALTVKPVRVIL